MKSDLVRLDVLLNGKEIQELSTVSHTSKVKERAKAVVFKLKSELPRQQFSIAIQALWFNRQKFGAFLPLGPPKP